MRCGPTCGRSSFAPCCRGSAPIRTIPIVRGLYAVTEPVLSRLRRKLPLFAGSIDFAPMVAVLVIVFLQRFVVRTLFDLALRMP